MPPLITLFCIQPLTRLLVLQVGAGSFSQDPEHPSLSLSCLSPPIVALLRSCVPAFSRRPVCSRSPSAMAQHTGEPSSSLASGEIPTSVSPSPALASPVSSPLLVQETSQPLYLDQGSTLADLELVTEFAAVTATLAPGASPSVPSQGLSVSRIRPSAATLCVGSTLVASLVSAPPLADTSLCPDPSVDVFSVLQA